MGGHFFGGNYALKITDAPIDVDAGLNVQDATRADDAVGKKQNDSHENDNRNIISQVSIAIFSYRHCH